jgi:hypothetical protein
MTTDAKLLRDSSAGRGRIQWEPQMNANEAAGNPIAKVTPENAPHG